MDKIQLRAAARAFMRASPQSSFVPLDQELPRKSRERAPLDQERRRTSRERPLLEQEPPRISHERRPPPLDKARARQACAPMGALHSRVVTVNPRHAPR